MANNIAHELEEFENMVKDGQITTFWVSFRNKGLFLHTPQADLEQIIPLEQEMYDSLYTFFYGVEKIEYNSHDYTNLKCFINARVMLNRMINKESKL